MIKLQELLLFIMKGQVEKKLVDESPIVTTPPTQTIYTTTTEGKSKIITTDVETFKKNVKLLILKQ